MVISLTQPGGEQGRIWVETWYNSNHAFNALSGGTLTVYPVSVWQCQSGGWVRLDAAITRDGTLWESFETWLYNRGDECSAITGGWTAKTDYNQSQSGNKDGSLVLYKQYGYQNKQNSWLYTSQKINFSKYTGLYADAYRHTSVKNGTNYNLWLNVYITSTRPSEDGYDNAEGFLIASLCSNNEQTVEEKRLINLKLKLMGSALTYGYLVLTGSTNLSGIAGFFKISELYLIG